MEEASGHHIAHGTVWLRFSQCGLRWNIGKAVDSSLDSTENALQAVSAHLPKRLPWAPWGGFSDWPDSEYG